MVEKILREAFENNKVIKKNNRCPHPNCKTKLKVTSIECRCGVKYCNIHRYAENHSCTFQYKDIQRAKLMKDNPLVSPSKIKKITE